MAVNGESIDLFHSREAPLRRGPRKAVSHGRAEGAGPIVGEWREIGSKLPRRRRQDQNGLQVGMGVQIAEALDMIASGGTVNELHG